MKNKRVYLIHGWGGQPEGGFRPWLKKELEIRGYLVVVPAMPETHYPKIEQWIPFLKELITDPDEDVIIVGHSLGCQAALRYVAELPEGVQIGKVVAVAGVVDQIMNLTPEDKLVAASWLDTPIDAGKVKRSVKEIIGIFSDNDKFIPLASEIVLREKFGARTQIERNMGHFSGEDGIFEAPIVLKAII